jgi:ABC-type enterobactin transport system permease subunit
MDTGNASHHMIDKGIVSACNTSVDITRGLQMGSDEQTFCGIFCEKLTLVMIGWALAVTASRTKAEKVLNFIAVKFKSGC